jgi:ubiquinone/menaquinone biosynthesis C-methylase UbiE
MGAETDADDVERFGRWAPTYEESWFQRYIDRVHRAALDLMARNCAEREPDCILDIGCGTGRLLRAAAERWPRARLLGVDAAEGMVEVARRLTPSASVHQGVAEALPLADASVGLVFSTISFHHWKDQAAGLREVVRVLRPGGWFCLADPTLPGWLTKVFRRSRVRSAAAIRRAFSEAGLEPQTQQRMLMGCIVVTVGRKATAVADGRGSAVE